MPIEAFFLKVERLRSAANRSRTFSNEKWKDRSLTSKSVYVISKTQESFNLMYEEFEKILKFCTAWRENYLPHLNVLFLSHFNMSCYWTSRNII